MKTWKKAGLTALAGSLVATSAFAGAMTVSGSANLTYTGETGAQDSASTTDDSFGNDGQRFGMAKSISFAGSGEMDNGWTVSLGTTFSNAGPSAVGITLDMGDAGSLDYEGGTSARGAGKIADMMPTADEDVGNGLDANGTTTGGEISGKITGGIQGFHYSKAMDMVEIGVGYAPSGGKTTANGATSGPGASASNTSAFIKVDPMDGLEIGYGVGEKQQFADGDSSRTDDYDTMYATYVYGPVTFGYQVSNIDTNDTDVATADDEATRWGILYAVNDEMSISYMDHVNDQTNIATDEEATGWSASYTMGSMTFKAHSNEGTGMDNTATKTSEHTEIGVTFAF
jgi:outer membrane protein OmpU